MPVTAWAQNAAQLEVASTRPPVVSVHSGASQPPAGAAVGLLAPAASCPARSTVTERDSIVCRQTGQHARPLTGLVRGCGPTAGCRKRDRGRIGMAAARGRKRRWLARAVVAAMLVLSGGELFAQDNGSSMDSGCGPRNPTDTTNRSNCPNGGLGTGGSGIPPASGSPGAPNSGAGTAGGTGTGTGSMGSPGGGGSTGGGSGSSAQ